MCIRDSGLVAAFRATLEETVHADLLLHVVDSASASRDEQAREVDKVLAEIPAGDAPRLLVWNKIDVAGLEPRVERDQYGRICRVFVSARTGEGLQELRAAIAEFAKERSAARRAAAAATSSRVRPRRGRSAAGEPARRADRAGVARERILHRGRGPARHRAE